MRSFAGPLLLALVGVALVGLLAGDPRAARTADGGDRLLLVYAALAVAVGALAWRGAGRSAWWLPPSLLLALMGGILGWLGSIVGSGDFERIPHLAVAPGHALMVTAATAAGMALPAALYAAVISRLHERRPLKPRGRART